MSEYIHFTAHAGYTVYSPESSGATANGSDFSGMYAQLDITHRVNQYVDYSLSGGRTISVAFSGGTIDRYFASWQANWRIVRKVDARHVIQLRARHTTLWLAGDV